MKWITRKIPAFLLALLTVFTMASTARALELPDLTRKCSFTVTVTYDGKPVSGGTLSIYRVGEVAEDDADYSFKPTGRFKDFEGSFDNVRSATLPTQLRQYINNNSIPVLKTSSISKKGVVTFEDLTSGLYLVVQRKAASGYSALGPFLVSLPYYENGTYKYDIAAVPKTELEREPTGTTKTQDTPQTGQLWWPVPMLVCGGLILVCIGFSMRRRKRFDEA